ncbi:putative short-chain dehydrogenases/reductase [Acaromyces ingoldii]|uniref:Putative short-chain dehydrogenases/reductase n=1 Tax=Acaromyces ingoldii TaxID=215250 RepID=A0A316YEH6_9BASI|nr:putative short-chain dehydrogenases/reductase [Acaromyces ingoldii]PWN87284.1 putative short-chain dehydrogenases/reductase [Acaromyces ingoldii]
MTKLAAIFGAGQRVGKSVALQFLREGYQVAVVSRSGAKSLDEEAEKFKGSLRRYSADLGWAEDAVRVWNEIKKDFSTPISVVFYNAAANSSTDKFFDFQVSVDDLRRDQEINALSLFALAREAVRDFKGLPASVPKAFIYTGNGLDDPKAFPKTPPGLLTGAVGKHAAAHFIDAASQTFGAEGYKFYYIDERLADGAPAYGKITGPGHADMVWKLSQEPTQGDWRVSFINGKGKI